MVYDEEAKDQTYFNTSGSPLGMHTSVCICCSLLHLTNMEPEHRSSLKGSHMLVPHGTQFKHLLPEITVPCNHRVPLINHNTGKPYPMVPVGDFCLIDCFFPRYPRDSLLYYKDELSQLCKRRYSIPTYQAETHKSTSTKKETSKSPYAKEDTHKPSNIKEEPCKSSSKASRTSSPWATDFTSTSKPSCKGKCSPLAKEHKDKCDHKDCHPHSGS